MPPRIYILDSHGQLYASFYALPNLTSPKGEPTGATFGFVSTLLKILREEKPEYLVACFDLPGPTHRHEAFEAYKAQRKPMPDDLVVQVRRAREVLDAMGIRAAESPGYEADDCIATLTARARRAGFDVVICSRDKDLEQLVAPGVTMLDTKTGDRLDPAGIRKKRGVTPEQTVDVLALAGDATDNIPGVPGIGPKNATKLVAEYESLDNLLAHAEEVKGKVGENLRAHREDALRSRELVRLVADVPLALDPEDCAAPRTYDASAVVALFRDLGFNAFLEELDPSGGAAAAPIRTHLVETPEALEKLAKALAKEKAFAFDTETTSVSPRRAELAGLSFAWADGEGYYVPLKGLEQGRCLPLKAVAEALGPVLASPKRLLVGQNVKYDLLVCRRAGLELAEPFFDTMVAAYLVNPGRREYNLDALALDYFGYKKIPLSALLGAKKSERTMAEVPIQQAAEYSVEDAVITWRLKGRLEKELADAGLADLAREVEMPLVPVLAAMEETGVAVDTTVLADIAEDLGRRLARLEKKIYKEAGREFLINSPQQLGAVLFDDLGLKPTKRTAKGKRPSTDAGVLEELARRHPLPRLVLEYRSLAKLKGTYVDALPQLVDPETRRIHTSFNQTATATGRLSSSDPNLQNIPIRTDEGRQVRRAFVPGEKGWVLLAADYSQIELRMLAHYSDDPALCRAFADDRDIHRFVASQLYGVAED
ncbi:MAG TPA: DNA polymerase I, partial [Phycisphaerae bacterium]|nr:DNA polymerase I [Phycisphaerae bacterium]